MRAGGGGRGRIAGGARSTLTTTGAVAGEPPVARAGGGDRRRARLTLSRFVKRRAVFDPGGVAAGGGVGENFGILPDMKCATWHNEGWVTEEGSGFGFLDSGKGGTNGDVPRGTLQLPFPMNPEPETLRGAPWVHNGSTMGAEIGGVGGRSRFGGPGLP